MTAPFEGMRVCTGVRGVQVSRHGDRRRKRPAFANRHETGYGCAKVGQRLSANSEQGLQHMALDGNRGIVRRFGLRVPQDVVRLDVADDRGM
jgi:hypothetical protein